MLNVKLEINLEITFAPKAKSNLLSTLNTGSSYESDRQSWASSTKWKNVGIPVRYV